eukprot:comp12632_c0_seq1/m.7678 comp12632_c0_seq1/g.7678  ORF comp12632_c0_seq1/g.7678 comp12632_c0_seq1/m.7678 type:complete len:498 (-) comp12632_c0_seq1:512-2005(-)
MTSAFTSVTVAALAASVAGQVTFTPQEAWKKTILSEHQRVRRSVAAADMAALLWDPALECLASNFLNNISDSQAGSYPGPNLSRGAMYLECGGKDPDVGENWYSDSPADAVRVWSDFEWPKLWGYNGCSERQNYASANQDEGVNAMPPAGMTLTQCYSGATGHFSQVVWADSRRVGCANRDGFGTVCYYWPAGNVPGKRYATDGQACSKCPTDLPVCQAGLCVPLDSTVPVVDTTTNTCSYAPWSDWLPCNTTCGPDYVTRVRKALAYRADGRCGKGFPAPNGQGDAICNPVSVDAFCCSSDGYCGNTEKHCSCSSCKNYKQTGNLPWRSDYRCGYAYAAPNGQVPSECNPHDPNHHCCSPEGVCGGSSGYCRRPGSIDYNPCPDLEDFKLKNDTTQVTGTIFVEGPTVTVTSMGGFVTSATEIQVPTATESVELASTSVSVNGTERSTATPAATNETLNATVSTNQTETLSSSVVVVPTASSASGSAATATATKKK